MLSGVIASQPTRMAAKFTLSATRWLQADPQPDWLASVRMLRTYEGRCAGAYFNAYVGISLPWRAADARIVPPYWLSIRARSSPLSHNGIAHHAVDPFNATLN